MKSWQKQAQHSMAWSNHQPVRDLVISNFPGGWFQTISRENQIQDTCGKARPCVSKIRHVYKAHKPLFPIILPILPYILNTYLLWVELLHMATTIAGNISKDSLQSKWSNGCWRLFTSLGLRSAERVASGKIDFLENNEGLCIRLPEGRN